GVAALAVATSREAPSGGTLVRGVLGEGISPPAASSRERTDPLRTLPGGSRSQPAPHTLRADRAVVRANRGRRAGGVPAPSGLAGAGGVVGQSRARPAPSDLQPAAFPPPLPTRPRPHQPATEGGRPGAASPPSRRRPRPRAPQRGHRPGAQRQRLHP